MKAWQLERLGGALNLNDLPVPEPRPGSVVVRMEASSLMSYMKDYVDGKLPIYHAPDGPFIPGGNGVGVIHAVGRDVWHLNVGQRVVISSHFVAQENVANPAQILIGVTAAGALAERVQADWRDGTLADYALLPATTVTPADDCSAIDAARLAVSMRYVVPYGGLLRGRLAAGETVVVSGATGAYGTAAVLLAVAMGAARVIAVGRNAVALDALANAGRGRVTPVAVTGDSAADVEMIRAASHGGADMAFDMVGGARDPNMTLAALRSLVPGGRLVLMGSMAVPLPLPYTEVMMNSWEILGQFMYPRVAYRRLLALIGTGELDMSVIRPVTFALHALPDAIERAAAAGNFECVVIEHKD
jgi:alcohol dehydrogenase